MEKSQWPSFMQLFESSNFSDSVVSCDEDGTTWNVHKAVLCTRSKWFDKALNERFAENKTGVVTIAKIPASKIDWILRFIYGSGSSIDAETMRDLDRNPYVAAYKAYELADFFDIELLRLAALHSLTDELDKAYENSIPAFRPLSDDEDMIIVESYHANCWSVLMKGARRAYNLHSAHFQVIQKPFLDYVRRLAYAPLYVEVLVSELEHDHSFKSHILSAMLKDHGIYSSIKLEPKFPLKLLCVCPWVVHGSGWSWREKIEFTGDKWKYYKCNNCKGFKMDDMHLTKAE